MGGVGIPELLVIAILIGLIAFPIWLSCFLRKKYPRRIWIGMLLAFFLPALGQWYLEGALWWILGLGLTWSVFKIASGNAPLAWISTMILSALVMYYRLLKAKPLILTETNIEKR
jgi:H+/Cl- antiporter ClcA